MAASFGLRSVIFVPERAPDPKVTQLLIFGATVLRVRGSYEQAFQRCASRPASDGVGTTATAPSIRTWWRARKPRAWRSASSWLGAPDWVAVSIGDGCTIAGVWKAFWEMKTLGLIERTPKILGVQAAGAAPVTAAFRSGEAPWPIQPQTIADSIAVGVPRNWKKAVLAVRGSAAR